MTTNDWLVASVVAASLYDVYITEKRLTQFGAGIDLNPAIQFLARRFGPKLAAAAGVALPTMVILTALRLWGLSDNWMAFYAGMKVAFGGMQALSELALRRLRSVLSVQANKEKAG